MNRKQALIVDDSKTAQYLLKRMLQQYDLNIDVAASAEEALAYLSYNHPAVIFLDQQMTGMTGFEALKTIKANPHTALIPVIMYTSQNDDLFVGQAIALGAQGILSKSALQPANLQQVLQRLNIRKSGESVALTSVPVNDTATQDVVPEEQAVEEMAAPAPATVRTMDIPDIEKVRQQVGRLFEFHVADLKTHINNSTQFIIKRLSTSIDKAASREPSVGNNVLASVKSTITSAMLAQRPQKSLIVPVMLALLVAGMAGLAYALLQVQSDSQAASQKILAMLEQKHADRSMLAIPASVVSADKPGDPARTISPALLQAISWAQSADFHFDYGEQPLSGARLSNLNQLVYLLAEGGYRGPLVVNINFGNFCLEQDETGALRPARSDTKLAACKMQKDLTVRFTTNDYITLPYQAFEKNAAPLQDGRIAIRLVTNGMNTPTTDYPAATPQTTAGEWNRVALRNNRISVQFPN